MKKLIPELKLRNSSYEGGFSALPIGQLLKLKGGVIMNINCPLPNTSCGTPANN